MSKWAGLCVLIVLQTGSASTLKTPLKGNHSSHLRLIHTVVPSECNEYQDWQVLGLFWSWKKVGSPGMFTRIACCKMDQLKGQQSMNPYQVYYTDINIDPEGIGDNYIPYNKPYGVMSWLQDVQPAGDYFLIVDADMTFHRSFTVDELGVGPGWGAAQNMWYMSELNQFIAQKLLPPHVQGVGTIRRQLRAIRPGAAHQRADKASRPRPDVLQTEVTSEEDRRMHSALMQAAAATLLDTERRAASVAKPMVSQAHQSSSQKPLPEDALDGVDTEQASAGREAESAAEHTDLSLQHSALLQGISSRFSSAEQVPITSTTAPPSAIPQSADTQSDPVTRHRALLQQASAHLPRDGQQQSESAEVVQEEAVAQLANAVATLPLADEVGEVYLYEAGDLRRIAPLWWSYTKQMRTFHETYAKELPKDTPVERPWIAEMYAIALGAAHLGIHHHAYNDLVMHPPGSKGTLNKEGPNMVVSHYAWNAEVPSMGWKWNKHAFTDWSALTCPPWNLDQQSSKDAHGQQFNRSTGGLFTHPPFPSELTNQAPAELFQDLVNIEMVAMLNEGFCELHHKAYCPPSEELSRECGKATRLMQELAEYYRKLANGSTIFCIDTDVAQCAHNRESSNKAELCQEAAARQACHRTCGLCHADFDSSHMVWYNQPQNSATETSSAYASRDLDEDDLSDLSSVKRTDIGAAVSLLNGVLLRRTGDPDADANGGFGGDVSVASEIVKEESHSNSSAVEIRRDRSSEGQISTGAGLSDATESARSNKGIARTRSWKEHVSNPFCFSLLFLCLVMLACMLWLAKMRFRRKRLPR